jgi:riboflavin biosynthesis pyrimidine reductase
VIVRRAHPAPDREVSLDAADSRDQLLEWYKAERAQWLRLNLVSSVSGSAAGSDGTSETLTSASDRRILGVIRELSDVVLVGAASVRAEGYQVPRRSRLAVLTSTGDLTGHRLDVNLVDRVTIVCPASAVARATSSLPGAEILVAPDTNSRIAMPALVNTLRAAGYASIVCEGGPSLASALIEAGLVDELCLTTSPVIRDVSLPTFAREGLHERAVELRQLLIDDNSFVFARWTIRAD